MLQWVITMLQEVQHPPCTLAQDHWLHRQCLDCGYVLRKRHSANEGKTVVKSASPENNDQVAAGTLHCEVRASLYEAFDSHVFKCLLYDQVRWHPQFAMHASSVARHSCYT